jgi:hypothetical protein
VSLTVHGGTVTLSLWSGGGAEPPELAPGAGSSGEDPGETTWTISRDVLRRTTTCIVRHGSAYAIPGDGTASEEYAGEVVVDRRTFAQGAAAECNYRLRWSEVDVRVSSTMRVAVDAEGYDVAITTAAFEGDQPVSHRVWSEHFPR